MSSNNNFYTMTCLALCIQYVQWNRLMILYCFVLFLIMIYRQIYNIRRALIVNKIIDHSDVVGASPVGAAPTTSSFST